MNEIIEYEPKRKRSDIPFWIAAFLGVLLFIAWSVNDNRRMQEARDAREAAEKAEKADRRRDAAILRELEAQTDATNRAAREAREREKNR